MVRDVAHLPLSNQIFTEDHVRLSSLANMGYFATSASDTNAKIGMESQLEKLGKQNDLSYSGFRNKRFTKDEYRNYKDSLEGGIGRVTTADTPNSAAENMRRLEGKYAGEIGSFDFTGTIPQKEDGDLDLNFLTIKKTIDVAGLELCGLILAVTGKNKLQLLGMTEQYPDLVETYAQLDGKSMGLPLRSAMNNFDDPDKLRRARAELDENISALNKLLSELKNDQRVHMPIVHLISLMNHGGSMIDIYYNNASRGKKDDELQNIREKMKNNEYRVTANGTEANMTPTHYESYLQIYKSPQEAVTKYARFKELESINEDPARVLNANEKKELEKLARIDKLAKQFDQSHRYMLEKGSYSQQDVDYAFDLSKKEQEGDANGAILNNSTSGIYQSLILEKIFGGMKQRYLAHVKPEDAKNTDTIRAWLEEDLNNCVARKKDDFIIVLRAIARTAEEKSPEFLNYEFGRIMNEHWFEKVFKPNEKIGALAGGPNFILEAFSQILNGEQTSQFRNTLTGLYKIILADGELAKPDSVQKAKIHA